MNNTTTIVCPSRYNPSYWNGHGPMQREYDLLTLKLVPLTGRADTDHGEWLRLIGNLYFEVYGNGGNGNTSSRELIGTLVRCPALRSEDVADLALVVKYAADIERRSSRYTRLAVALDDIVYRVIRESWDTHMRLKYGVLTAP
jgi:hypothetical protein